MIYKPTDLSPSAQTFDVIDTPIFFECKVDTSNVQASGFTIEILDSENNVVFSSIPEGEQLNINYITIIDDLREYIHAYFPDYETGYSLLNTGYNGSYLKFPFSVAYDSRANNTSAINQIFYIPDPNGIVKGLTEDEVKISSGLYRYNYIWTTGDNPEYIIDTSKPLIPVKIYNGKEYKWSITLYQLDNVGTTKNPVWILPENPLMFDMPMTTGTVLGSNNKRIQSAFSEEIYGDYFIQPLKIDGLNYNIGEEDKWTYSGAITQIGKRVMIKSYDMSFGYIYPMEGDDGIPEGDIVPDRANAFRIYKRGNNPDDLTDYQKVSYVLEDALVGDDPSNKDAIITLEWKTSLANAGESYYEQKWSGVIDQSGAYTPPGFPPGVLVYPNERIVLNGQGGKDESGKLIPSAFNGIYYPQFSSEALESAPIYSGKTGVTINIDLPNTFSNEFNQNGSYTLTYNGSVWQCNDKNYSCNIGDGVVTIGDAGLKIIYQNSTTEPGVGDSITFTIKHQIVARWIRTPDADTWGELVNKIVMVTRAGSPYFGKNIQIIKKEDADPEDKTGTINQTEFTFTEELPVNIYAYDYDSTNPDRNNIGLIFYNNPITTSNKNGILYIRYFEGIQKGMMLQKLSSDNKYQYFIIDDVGTNGGMYLKYHEVKEFDTYKSYTISNTVANANPTKLTADTTWDIDETKYQIKTYFRESDENAFYFYSRPEVDIQFENTAGVNFVKNRTPLIDAYEWEKGRIYGKGDYVYTDTGNSEPYTRTYYLCNKDNTETEPQQSSDAWTSLGTYPNGGISEYQEGIYYKKDIIVKYNNVFYISLTNITQLEDQPIKPEKENLGIFWEPYVGVLFREDIGFSYSTYNDLKVYNKGAVVYFQGKYYQVLKDITSISPPTKYSEKDNYNAGSIVWVLDNKDNPEYYTTTSDINQSELSQIPGQDNTSWVKYDDFSNFIWNPYTNAQIRDESGNFIEYNTTNTVIYKGLAYVCNIDGLTTNGYDTIDSFMASGYWDKYTKLDGDEIFIGGIRYNKDHTIYNEFNPKNMYMLDRVIYCDGIQYKVTSNETNTYNGETTYKYGDTVKYDIDKIGIYEYYIYISENPASGKPPIILNDDGKKILNDDYWSPTVINTLPKITDINYYNEYTSWSNKILYNHGDIVLYNNVFYVYINENANRKSKYNSSIEYKTGDLVRYSTSGGAFEWKFYIKEKDPCYIIPKKDSSYPNDYVSTDFWIPYYGFMYYGDYNDGVSIGAKYNYNNVVSFNGQYYIYVNPNINSYIDDDDKKRLHNKDISLLKLSENQSDFKGNEKYSVGDIVIYNDKYYICYKDMEDWLYSPANTSYWTLFPWQIFIPQIHERTIVCNGEYLQQQYIQWKSVQWFLCEEDGETILDKSEVIYDGDLTYTFHGVDGREKGSDKPVYFIIRLVIETRTGYRMTIDKKIEAIYEIEEIDSEGLISAYFDCDTMSVITEVTKESGFIIPTISEAGTRITYSEGENGEDGVMDLSGEVNYEKVLYSLESVSDIASAKDITSESERFELMGSHTINTDRFSGTIVSISSSVANATTEETQEKGSFEIYLTQMLKNEGKIDSDDTELSREDKIVLDDDRNVLQWRAKDVNGQVDFEGVVEVRNISGVGTNVIPQSDDPDSKSGDLGEFFDLDNFITCSNWQPKNFNYKQYENANYLPITYARCFEKDEKGIIESGKYRNIKQSLNLYDDSAYEESKIDKTTPCKRVQEPIISISNILPGDNSDPNIFNATAFNISPEYGSENSVGGITAVNIVGNIPTLCSDFAYKETYGVIEGMTGTDMYIRKKNVWQNFAYAYSDSETYTKNENGDIPELSKDNVVWNNNMNMWSDGDFITTSGSITYNIGKFRLNDESIDLFEDKEYKGNSTDNSPYSNSVLGYQEPISDNGDWDGKNEIDVIPEREYLNGKTLIIDAELMMDGDGGITPYPNYEQPDKIVVYVDAPESARTKN